MKAGGRPDLRRILIAYTVNELGTWFGYIALAVAVYDHTHSALATAGLFVSARFVPALLVPALVARVEASTRRGELGGLYLVEAVASVALGVLLWHFWLPAVLLLVAIDGTAALAASALLRAAAARAAQTDPASRAPEEGARRANASLNIAFSASVAIGPAIAGLLVAAWGASAALFIDAGSFLACGLLLLELRPHVEDIGARTMGARLKAAWGHVRERPQLRRLLTGEAVALVFFAFVEPIEVIYAKATLHAGDAGFGAIAAVWGVGMVLGSLLFRRWVRRPLGPLLVAGTLAVGVAYLGLAAAGSLGVACLVAIVGGAGNGMQWASLISAVQGLTPSGLQGQLMGAVESIGAICPAIGFSLGGLVAAASDPRVALTVAGAGAASLTLMFLRIMRGGLAPTPAAPERPGNADAVGGAPAVTRTGPHLASPGKASASAGR